MNLDLILVIVLLIIVGIVVAIDQYRTEEPYTLGSEWDFTKADFKPKNIDNTK